MEKENYTLNAMCWTLNLPPFAQSCPYREGNKTNKKAAVPAKETAALFVSDPNSL